MTVVEQTIERKQVNDSNTGDLISIESTTTTESVQQIVDQEPQKILESVTVIETTETITEPDTELNGESQNVDQNKIVEPENNEMTGKLTLQSHSTIL